MPESNDLVIIFQTPYESKKIEVQNLLTEAGIEVETSESSSAGETPGEIKARLLIKLSDVEKAEQILWEKGFL